MSVRRWLLVVVALILWGVGMYLFVAAAATCSAAR